ncbi:enoyl-CoA hydratase EchA19-like isoform X3 [Lithobates pipiens]
MLVNRVFRPQVWKSWTLSSEAFTAVFSSKKRLYSSNCDQSRGNMNVITERHGSILTIGINRPEARNAVNPDTAGQLVQAFNEFEKDPSLTAAVLHGLGGNFCAGFDLKEIAHSADSLKIEPNITKGPGPMGPSRMQFSKPVIAAVSGYAVAGGLELSLLADLRVAEESAIFGVFCRRFGLKCAIELAEQISSFPQKCMRADRASAYYSTFDAANFTDAMQYEFDNGANVLAEESVAGARRFQAGEGRKGKL